MYNDDTVFKTEFDVIYKILRNLNFIMSEEKGGIQMTQEERDQLLRDLKNSQEKMLKSNEERDKMWKELKNSQEKILKNQKEIRKDIRDLSQSVAKIEVEHGQKLEILLDVVTSQPQKFESVEKKLDKHENKLNSHSDQIYYLNSKVQAF